MAVSKDIRILCSLKIKIKKEVKYHLGLSSGLVWSLANAFTSVPVLQRVTFEIDVWDLSRENRCLTVSYLVEPASQVG